SFTIGAGPMTGLTVASPGTQTAGTAFGTTVTATDTWGNTIVGYNGTKAMTWTNPLSSPAPVNKGPDYGGAATSVLFNNGVGAVGQITLYNAALTTLKATATAGGFTGTSPSFTVVPDSASSFTFGAIGAQVAGTAFSATLTAKDQWANVATNFTGSKAITWGGAANSPNGTPPVLPTPVAFAAGVGSTGAAIQLYKAASTTLTATSGAASGSSNAFNVSAAPGLLTMSACGTVKTKNLTWTFTVTRGKDAYGNNDANAASAVTVTANYSDTANGGNKGKVAPATLNIAGGSTTTTNFTVTNPAKSGETVTLTASAPGYTTSPTCTYSTP
ncbi:MAG: hypothetical protein ACXVRJ_14505, partial [Gaiellaceae bacterium]